MSTTSYAAVNNMNCILFNKQCRYTLYEFGTIDSNLLEYLGNLNSDHSTLSVISVGSSYQHC